ncbi:MAG: M42 family peptidase [Candidatus Omnitrophota bacterium]|nr:M20/M25/M40 family metallo-hydrolase [Candidatus Omnitrophota bacterium]
MNAVLRSLLNAAGVSGYESAVAAIMERELAKSCDRVSRDVFGNVIAVKGKGKKKLMLAAHMDEVGFAVKYVSKEGYVYFVKVGGIDDRILLASRVVIKAKKGDCCGVIGSKPPHLQKEEDKKQLPRHEDMFIDIGATTQGEALGRIEIADSIIFEPNAGVFAGNLCYGKAVDDRVGCYALLKVMEKIDIDAQVFAVATAQEEVGLKGARTSGFKINPDFALVIDTTMAGDTPGIQEVESSWKLGAGVAITVIEAGGRGVIVNESVKRMLIEAAQRNAIKYQLGVVDGGMTDAAMIYMSKEGVPTGVLSIPTRYIHGPTGVFDARDVESAIALALKASQASLRMR